MRLDRVGKHGKHGNGHMMMLEKNNLAIAPISISDDRLRPKRRVARDYQDRNASPALWKEQQLLGRVLV